MQKNVNNSRSNYGSVRFDVILLISLLFYIAPVFFAFIAKTKIDEWKHSDFVVINAFFNNIENCKKLFEYEHFRKFRFSERCHMNCDPKEELLQLMRNINPNSCPNDSINNILKRKKRDTSDKPNYDDVPRTWNDTEAKDSEKRHKLFGWPVDDKMLKRLEVFITRHYEEFMSKYYDPEGFHEQETHPIYGRYGTRFITKFPITRTNPYNKLITKLFTRAPNHTFAFSTKYYPTNQTLPPPDTNTRPRLFGWPVDDKMMERLEVFVTRHYEEFMSKYYDPEGFHEQETHPIYGRYGTRFLTKLPLTRTNAYNKLITKVFTRGPNHTFAFTVRPTEENESKNKLQWYDELLEQPRIPRKKPRNGTTLLPRTKLFGWPVDGRMLQRLEVFITRHYEEFMSKYYDPEGFHEQETHPIYGRYGTRFLTKLPLTRTPPYNKLITKLFTRPPNHTFAFSTKYFPTNQTLPPLDTNTRPRLFGWPVDDQMMARLELFITRHYEEFMSKYYDPEGFHEQETHPIYGRYGTRFLTKYPITRTNAFNNLITKVFTRPPNHTFAFSTKAFSTPEFGYYSESEIDESLLKEYNEEKRKKQDSPNKRSRRSICSDSFIDIPSLIRLKRAPVFEESTSMEPTTNITPPWMHPAVTDLSLLPKHLSYKYALPDFKYPTIVDEYAEGFLEKKVYTGEYMKWKDIKKWLGTRQMSFKTLNSVEQAWDDIVFSGESTTEPLKGDQFHIYASDVDYMSIDSEGFPPPRSSPNYRTVYLTWPQGNPSRKRFRRRNTTFKFNF